jgi:hypothetical protein
LIVKAKPTLDEMLAAAFVRELVAGRSLPSGAEAFARYVGAVREGLMSGDLPLFQSIEGMFMAIRTDGIDGELTGPAGQRFATAWQQMKTFLLGAAAEGRDPVSEPLFPGVSSSAIRLCCDMTEWCFSKISAIACQR